MCMKFLRAKYFYKPLIEYISRPQCLPVISFQNPSSKFNCAVEMLRLRCWSMATNVNSSSCIFKLSKHLENSGFVKSCGEDLYRILSHFSGVTMLPAKITQAVVSWSIRFSRCWSDGHWKDILKISKRVHSLSFLVSPKTLSSMYRLLRVPSRSSCSERLLRARCKSAHRTLREKTDH